MRGAAVDLRRNGLEGLAAHANQAMKNAIKDFVRPIRYSLTDASGAVFAICDGEPVELLPALGRFAPKPGGAIRWPLVAFFSDAAGNEVTLTIGPQTPDSGRNLAPPARYGA